MNNPHLEAQARLQARAEQAEREGLPSSDPAVEQYRLVLRALKQPLAMQLPDDFAVRVATRASARASLPEEKTSVEDWLMSLLMLGLAITGLVYLKPVMLQVVATLDLQVPDLPWPLLAAAAASVAVAWAVDRGAINWRTGHGL